MKSSVAKPVQFATLQKGQVSGLPFFPASSFPALSTLAIRPRLQWSPCAYNITLKPDGRSMTSGEAALSFRQSRT
jgi:hypothetical protein